MKTIHYPKQSGSSLVVVISVLATLMVIVGVAAEYTWTVNRHVQRSNTLQSAVAVGDSAIDILFSNWRKICSDPPNTTQPLATSFFQAIPLPTSIQFPNIPGFAATATDYYGASPAPSPFNPPTISNFKVVAADAEWQPLASSAAVPIPGLGQIAQAVVASDLPTTGLVYNYIASADVTLPALGPTGNRTVVAKVRRVFQKQQLSPWNFAIFYLDPLEIHPGAPFTVTGWVHTNSDLYTGHSNLTFADKVTYGSDWFVNFMTPAANPRSWVDSFGVTQYAVPAPGDTTHPETPTAPNYPPNLPPTFGQLLQPFGLDSTSIFNSADANPNNDSYHELIEQPTPGYPDPLAGMRYSDQAAIRILIDASSNLTIKKANGTTVTSSSTGNNLKLYNAITGALTTNQSIQDNREAASVRLTTLDVGDVLQSLKNLPGAGNGRYIDSSLWNGIIYITDTSYNPRSPSTTRRGIRLKNGKVLPGPAQSSQITIDGLTIASANPVYIQGDYNTGAGTVPSNLLPPNNDPTTPQSSGYTRAPAAVVADAVTILSNNWLDTNALSDFTSQWPRCH